MKEKPLLSSKIVSDELKPKNLVELENYCGQAATKAINSYQEAVQSVKDYNRDVVKVIDDSGTANVASPIWKR